MTAASDAVQQLIDEHQKIKGLLERLTAGADSQSRKAVLEQLKGVLTIHNAVEENLIYPALSKVAHKRAESQKLYSETAEADMAIFEIDAMLKAGDDAEFPKKAEKLRAAILEHIDDEESKAFRHLQEKSPPGQTQMLNDSVREFRAKFHMSGARSATKGET